MNQRGWRTARGSELFEFIRGVSYRKADARPQPGIGLVGIVRAGNIQDGRLDLSDLVYVPDRRVGKAQRLRQGDLIVAMSSGSAAVVGKAAVVEQDYPGLSCGTFCGLLRPQDPALAPWLHCYFQTPAYRAAMTRAAAGIHIHNLKRDHLLKLEIPLPPLPEQQRILAQLAVLNVHCRQARAALARVLPQLEQLQQSVLAAACCGDLTAGWRAGRGAAEPARATEPAGAGTAVHQPPLPAGWCWTTLGDVALVTKLAGFEYSRSVRYDPNGDLAVIKAENVSRQGFRPTDFSYVRAETVAHLTRSRLAPHDLLMVFVGGGLGQVGLVPPDRRYFLGPNVALIRLVAEQALPAYMELYLRSPLGFTLATAAAKATAQGSLSMRQIRQIPCPLPPRAEQAEIVDRVRRSLALQAPLAGRANRLAGQLQRLEESILARTGVVTANDRTSSVGSTGP